MKTRSFLKWAGSKFTLLSRILESLPKGPRFIEPFTGSGVVFLNTDYPCYLLAETNPDLITLFQCIQREGEGFIEDAKRYFVNHNTAAAYTQLRSEFNESCDPRLRSLLFIYLNRHGYNGLCRYNQRGLYNVPFGRHTSTAFPEKALRHFYQKSQQTQFLEADFRTTFAMAIPGDVIYCDPPYVPLTKTACFSSYTRHPFTEMEQIALADMAREAANKGITVIISNHDTEFTRHHYRHACLQSFPVRRLISCKSGQRVAVNELLAVFQ